MTCNKHINNVPGHNSVNKQLTFPLSKQYLLCTYSQYKTAQSLLFSYHHKLLTCKAFCLCLILSLNSTSKLVLQKFNMSKLKEESIIIREVWASNLEYEFSLIRQVIHQYSFISLDTEFPGVIHLPKVDRRYLTPSDHYHYLKANVDALKLIQVGLTLSDAKGNLPNFGGSNSYIWEFNFCDFDVNNDLYNQDSIAMLCRQGIDFNRNFYHGVNSVRFAELMIASVLVFHKSIVWVTFSSAYDFGYLVKILTQNNLPNSLEGFLNMVEALFGKNVYDMKHMMKFCNALYGGLERVATTLNVGRAAGKSHQAGSDSLLTWHVFKKMMDTCFVNNMAQKHAGVLFGLEMIAVK